jgi:hypothetical protein
MIIPAKEDFLASDLTQDLGEQLASAESDRGSRVI